MRKIFLTLAAGMLTILSHAQISRLGEEIEYKGELSGQFGTGDYTPFWQSANRYGLASTDNNSGYFRAAIRRSVEADSLRKWRIGYGADIVAPVNYSSKFILQQLYADFQYKLVRLSVGQKERPLEMKNQQLSSGGMAMGINARPLPEVRFDICPDFYTIKKTGNWLALKGHLAYGVYTDNRWQREFNAGAKGAVYTANSLYHSKAGFVRIGNLEKFPLLLSGGIEMVCQFGGTVWNLRKPGDVYEIPSGIKQYFEAFIPSGNDVMDGDNPNATGNQVGSWHARLDYKGKGWGLGFYAEHFFEDHSQLGWDFAWKDMTYGVELDVPKNPFVSTLLYEHIRTTDQSGPVFVSLSNHVRPIGGVDDYYNHGMYGAYQHAGFVMGNPLLLSPLYNANRRIESHDNRIMANHFGISGNPHEDVSYRVLFTHEKSLGTYNKPRETPAYGNFLLVEATYRPHQVKGLGITASYGQNGGELIGRSKGGMLTVSYSGWINQKK